MTSGGTQHEFPEWLLASMLRAAQNADPADHGFVPRRTPFGTIWTKPPAFYGRGVAGELRATVDEPAESVGIPPAETPKG